MQSVAIQDGKFGAMGNMSLDALDVESIALPAGSAIDRCLSFETMDSSDEPETAIAAGTITTKLISRILDNMSIRAKSLINNVWFFVLGTN